MPTFALPGGWKPYEITGPQALAQTVHGEWGSDGWLNALFQAADQFFPAGQGPGATPFNPTAPFQAMQGAFGLSAGDVAQLSQAWLDARQSGGGLDRFRTQLNPYLTQTRDTVTRNQAMARANQVSQQAIDRYNRAKQMMDSQSADVAAFRRLGGQGPSLNYVDLAPGVQALQFADASIGNLDQQQVQDYLSSVTKGGGERYAGSLVDAFNQNASARSLPGFLDLLKSHRATSIDPVEARLQTGYKSNYFDPEGDSQYDQAWRYAASPKYQALVGRGITTPAFGKPAQMEGQINEGRLYGSDDNLPGVIQPGDLNWQNFLRMNESDRNMYLGLVSHQDKTRTGEDYVEEARRAQPYTGQAQSFYRRRR